ncbi:MAG: hypothetical protein ACTH2J_10820, partial [Candidatus Microbacterium stercoravium]
YPANRDVERIKLIFGDTGDLKALRVHFERHHEHYRQRRDAMRAFLDEVDGRRHRRIEHRIASRPTEAHGELTLAVRELAYRGDIARAENEMSWARDALEWLDRFEEKWGVLNGVLPLDGSATPPSETTVAMMPRISPDPFH